MTSSEQQLLLEIKETFKEFKFTLQDLRNPSEEFVMNFYSYFLQEFEVDINNIQQTQFNQAPIVHGYHEAYAGAIPKNNMLKSIRAFEIVPDFGMLDIISPTPKRTQELMRAFLNFYLWSDRRVSNIVQKKGQLNRRQEILIELLAKKDQLRESLNTITMEIPKIEDEKIQFEEQIAVVQKQLSDLNTEMNSHKERNEELEKKLKEEENILYKINQEISMIETKMKELSNHIVDSPSALLSEVQMLREKYEERKELQDQKRDLVAKKMETGELLENMLKERMNSIAILHEVLSDCEQLREAVSAAAAQEKKTTAAQECLTECKAKLLSSSNKKQICQEKLQSLYMMWKTLKPKLIENVESTSRDLADKQNAKLNTYNTLKKDAALQEDINTKMLQIQSYCKMVEQDYDYLQKEIESATLKLIENMTENMDELKRSRKKEDC